MNAVREPAVRVVVVSYQTRECLRRCLLSLREDVEHGFATVVVVDNGSTDGSVELVRDEFPWSKLITGFGNIGFGAAVNLGARTCPTPWLAASNADIEVGTGTLRQLIEMGHRHPCAGALAPRLVLPSGATQRSVYRFPRLSDRLISTFGGHLVSKTLARRLEYGRSSSPTSRDVDWAVGAFMLFRTEAFAAVGGFDETQWMYAEDMDICWRLARNGWSTRYVAEAGIRHIGEAAVGSAFAGRSQTLKLAAHYAWLERRFGRPVMLADAAAERFGAIYRHAILRLLRRWRPERWSDAYDRVEKWRELQAEALQIRNATRRATGDSGSDLDARPRDDAKRRS
jgi:N-acetylglucosaminyl-diphospho-decaprenol L-rhamnosyltransferase